MPFKFFFARQKFTVKWKLFTLLLYYLTDAHTQNLYVVLYSCMKLKFHGAEAIKITLLIFNLSHFNIYFFVQKNNIYQNILKNNTSPIWCYFQI